MRSSEPEIRSAHLIGRTLLMLTCMYSLGKGVLQTLLLKAAHPSRFARKNTCVGTCPVQSALSGESLRIATLRGVTSMQQYVSRRRVCCFDC